MKERRKKIIRERKNFLPSLLATLFLWFCLGLVVVFFSPEFPLAVIFFFLLLFLALFITFSLIFGSSRRGIAIVLAILIFLLLRYFGVGNLLNLVLIAGVAIASEIYFWYSDAQK